MPNKILLIVLLFLPTVSIAQTLDIEFGSPEVSHYSAEDYGAFRQNWSIYPLVILSEICTLLQMERFIMLQKMILVI
jgi:hypothetical protein